MRADEVAPAGCLSGPEERELTKLEEVIDRGLSTFVEVGLALMRIRDERLYRQTHHAFEAYCRERWRFSKTHANRLVAAAETAKILTPIGVNASSPSESVIRPLTLLPKDERGEVWEEAVSTTPGDRVTAVHVQSVVDRHRNAKAPRLQTRRTPRWLFDALNARFGPFQLDAFADATNALCDTWYGKDTDGCTATWVDKTFANPEFADMATPLQQALRQAKKGVRSIVLGLVGCSQAWYHELAIQGTIYVPDVRISYDLPDGTPTDGADRDSIVMAFGGEHTNKAAKNGIFRVQRLPLSAAMIATGRQR